MERKYPNNHEDYDWNADKERMILVELAYAPPEFMGILRDGPDRRRTGGTFGAPETETEGGEEDV